MTKKDNTQNTLEEGMFYEKVFGPKEVHITKDPESNQIAMTLTDENGESIELVDEFPIYRIYHYLRRPGDGEVLSIKDLRKLTLEEQMALMNSNLSAKPRSLKFLFDEEGECVGVTSKLHKQISWSEIRNTVDSAIMEVFGTVVKNENTPSSTSYDMQLSGGDSAEDPIHMFAHVDCGNNKIQGRSGIRITTRCRTDFDVGSGGAAPACHNWANVWTFQGESWFGVERKELKSMAEVKAFNGFEIHLQGTEIIRAEIVEKLRELKAFIPILKSYIKKAIHTPLSRHEMREIMIAYAEKKNLAMYVVEQVVAAVEDETVYGFSQAVSYVRTHGQIRLRGKSREESNLANTLETIAGEVYSLAPTIEAFHEKNGTLSYTDLMDGAEKPSRWAEPKEKLKIAQ